MILKKPSLQLYKVLKIKRFKGSQINSWLINVINFAQQKDIYYGYLIQNNFLILLHGGGQKQKEINCILPLQDQKQELYHEILLDLF
ncbi:unnamed protein product [Paramecium octaurelia]|uniref:Uncharacterized protein n=1 Tax=Paramecium octaurelia TaxID=43137 RepID=A0A8S1UB72_PAROT|nr:unnamed protein product [Paramecium octaurelia]